MKKIYGTYTQNDALVGQMADVIAHSNLSPPVGKYEAIDLDKIGNRSPNCKIAKEGEKSKWDRSGPIKKTNAPCIG